MVKNDLAFVVCVSQQYEGYLPFYILFNNLAYGNLGWDTVAYLGDGWQKRIGHQMDFLARQGFKYEVRRIPFNYKNENPQVFKYYRWLLNDNIWTKYKHLYFGDVDIMHVREKPNILEYHTKHMQSLKLPYSNYVRRSSKRMSGLHFVNTSTYYPYIAEVFAKYKKLVIGRNIFNERNEVMLYNMIKESGMKLAPYNPKFELNRHHGFHLRVFVTSNINRALEYYKTESFKYKDDFQKMANYADLYKYLYKTTTFNNVKKQFDMLFRIASI